jgi:hypothetical protein
LEAAETQPVDSNQGGPVEPQGILVLDDMRFQGRNPAIEDGVVRARRRILADERFVCAEINWSSGLLLATRVR